MFRNLRSNLWETALAFMVLGISSYFAVHYFIKLFPQVRSERPSQFSDLDLSHSFILSENDQFEKGTSPATAKCYGHFSGRFVRNIERAEYSLRGEIYLKLAGSRLPTNVEMEASFNILGQLGAAVLRVNNSFSSNTLGTLNINPVDVTFLSSAQGKPGERKQFSIPGPIILKDLGSEFEIEYPAAGRTIAINPKQFSLRPIINLQLQPINDIKSACSPEQQGEIDVIEIANKLNLKIHALLPKISFTESPSDPDLLLK